MHITTGMHLGQSIVFVSSPVSRCSPRQLPCLGIGVWLEAMMSPDALQVYDLRSVPRMTSSFAFNSGPTLLKFHTKLSSTLLVASARGVFTLADANGAAYSRYEQVRHFGNSDC